jgi:5,10-methylenetetrahydromethanopterin reductase
MRHELSIAFQTDKTPQQYVARAQLVNQYDFDVVSVYCDAPYHPSYGPLLLMAPHIQRARIGPAAVSPFRIHPIDIASESALLSQVAQGGTYLGIARGAWLEDHGIGEPARPIQALRESIDIVRYMLSGKSGGYQGEAFKLASHVKAPYPLPEHPIPVMIGSWGAKLCALAGEIADEVKVGGSANPDIIPHIQQFIAAGEQKAGRSTGSVGVVLGAVSVIDENREQARTAARHAVALYLPVVAPLDPTIQTEPELVERLRIHSNRHEFDAASRLISDDLLDRFAFSGNVADIVQQCVGLFAAGASRIEFGTPHGLNAEYGIRLLGEQVIPSLRQLFPKGD